MDHLIDQLVRVNEHVSSTDGLINYCLLAVSFPADSSNNTNEIRLVLFRSTTLWNWLFWWLTG